MWAHGIGKFRSNEREEGGSPLSGDIEKFMLEHYRLNISIFIFQVECAEHELVDMIVKNMSI